MDTPELLWEPSDEEIERAALTRYQRWLGETRGLRFDSYDELWRWSVDDLEGFWSSIVEFFEVRFEVAPERVLGRREMPGAEWFPGARVSFAEHVF
ncbi:MAG TPA: acetyl-coenzyme A synthetase N-terminal domain-containing protein, partial [Solirubrobacteraceae bacterium]|nr:acetyl-coenzyme A synthetase N-terminal domain-containing protein [Solirubrobacteraceae bacterium]